MACRACLKLLAIALFLLAYVGMWSLCYSCIFAATGIACTMSVLIGYPFFTPACLFGMMASIMKAFSMLRMELHFDE
jgi:hypothetical protein